jgi:hypothetical protein
MTAFNSGLNSHSGASPPGDELRNIPEARRLLVLHQISGVNGPGLMPKVVHRFTLRHTGIIVEELRRP